MDKRRQNEIKNYFDGLYRSGVTPWKNHPPEPQLDSFLRTLKKTKPKAKILDVGCGDGWISIKASKRSFETWGIDGSEKAIEIAKARSAEEGVQYKTHFQVGDALNLPYDDSFFDAIIDRGLFHHILPMNRKEYLKNILRVTKGKSLVYLSVFSKDNPEGIGQMFDREDVEKIFSPDYRISKFDADPLPSSAPAHLLHFILARV